MCQKISIGASHVDLMVCDSAFLFNACGFLISMCSSIVPALLCRIFFAFYKHYQLSMAILGPHICEMLFTQSNHLWSLALMLQNNNITHYLSNDLAAPICEAGCVSENNKSGVGSCGGDMGNESFRLKLWQNIPWTAGHHEMPSKKHIFPHIPSYIHIFMYMNILHVSRPPQLSSNIIGNSTFGATEYNF